MQLIPFEDSRPPAPATATSTTASTRWARLQSFLQASTRFVTSRDARHGLIGRSARDLRALLDFSPRPLPDRGLLVRDAVRTRPLVAGLQSLCFDPDIAVRTLRLLAKYQGTKVDPFTEGSRARSF